MHLHPHPEGRGEGEVASASFWLPAKPPRRSLRKLYSRRPPERMHSHVHHSEARTPGQFTPRRPRPPHIRVQPQDAPAPPLRHDLRLYAMRKSSCLLFMAPFLLLLILSTASIGCMAVISIKA